ncbi:hypothetical protein Angca_000177 [Angiostrongylus cantonensis]|nr:hypothetical protein Angca_000177 [Angiostrongylus cantonensis]
MLTLTILSLLSILPSVLIALKCHQIATANLSSPPETQPTECIAGSLACLKLIDYTSKTFSKQCHQFNCTAGALMNAPAQCTNTSQFGRETMTCCCYGDGCNSATVNSMWLAIATIILPFVGSTILI